MALKEKFPMGSKYIKRKKSGKNQHRSLRMETISAQSQYERLKTSFPDLVQEELSDTKFSVVIKLRPDVFSKEYDVRVLFETGRVSVYVIGELKIASNRTKLPHVYSNELKHICLYGKEGESWSSEKSIVSTIVPWASEWLYYYELWLIDGQWHGGGHDEYANEKKVKNE